MVDEDAVEELMLGRVVHLGKNPARGYVWATDCGLRCDRLPQGHLWLYSQRSAEGYAAKVGGVLCSRCCG